MMVEGEVSVCEARPGSRMAEKQRSMQARVAVSHSLLRSRVSLPNETVFFDFHVLEVLQEVVVTSVSQRAGVCLPQEPPVDTSLAVVYVVHLALPHGHSMDTCFGLCSVVADQGGKHPACLRTMIRSLMHLA